MTATGPPARTAGPAGSAAGLGRAAAARARRPGPYLLVGAAYWLVLSVVLRHTPPASDFGQHAAAVEQVREDWRHPANPLLAAPGTGSPYYSPYIVGLGLLAKASGVAGWVALRWCGALNVAVLVAGVGAYARTLSARALAPVYALAAFSLLWGVRGTEWSGFCGVWSLTRGASYPSAFAVGLTFLLWAWTDRLVTTPAGPRAARRWGAHAALGAAGGVLLLIHPITALAAAVGALATVAARQRTWSWHIGAGWAVTAAAAAGAAAAWPYFDVWTLAGDATLDAVHRTLYQQPLRWYGLAAVGLPALVWRARAGGRWGARDPLVLMFAADCAIAGYGWLSGHYTYGRVFALLLVPPQFALAVELAELPRWTRLRRVLAPLAAAALCCGLAAQIGAVVPRRLLPVDLGHPVRWHDYRWVVARTHQGDVVLTDSYQASHVLPAYGIRLVAPTWPDPSTPPAERDRRFGDLFAYLDSATPDPVRRDIAHRWGARWLLLGQDEHIPYQGTLVAWDVPSHERLIRLDAADGGGSGGG
ncbi:hypothetical protein V2S66_09740 [Streptomyces sp. V4-01]|uniref:Glycosyltransferase RgtA/B/C/D-like domain-containing protein n=1 Tax=Actinacidiphila polyblastidii TaxID=3110430 RepID=A0ABU7PAC3_9ACTN|nr:hypothetical protein [Streptomyces sp. V4-01]